MDLKLGGLIKDTSPHNRSGDFSISAKGAKIGIEYSGQLADQKGLAPFATGAGPGQDLELHLGCGACTPTPY